MGALVQAHERVLETQDQPGVADPDPSPAPEIKMEEGDV